MGNLNGILARIGGNLNNNFQKSQMPGRLPGGGMLKLRFDRYINQWTVSKRILSFKGKLVIIILVLLAMLCLEHKSWFSTLMHIVKLLFTKCNETKKYKEERGEKRDGKSFSSLFFLFL